MSVSAEEALTIKLRFKVGDRVQCRLSVEEDEWVAGTIIKLWYGQLSFNGLFAPYQILCDSGRRVYASTDTDFCIRRIPGSGGGSSSTAAVSASSAAATTARKAPMPAAAINSKAAPKAHIPAAAATAPKAPPLDIAGLQDPVHAEAICRQYGLDYQTGTASMPANAEQIVSALLALAKADNSGPRLKLRVVTAFAAIFATAASASGEEQVAKSSALKAHAAEQGAIPVLVDLLDRGTAQMKEQVALALWNLALYDTGTVKEAIANAGAIPPLVALTRRASTDKQMLKAAGALLVICKSRTTRQQLREEPGSALALVALMMSDTIAGQKFPAIGALFEMTKEGQAGRRAVVNAGGLQACIDIIKPPTKEDRRGLSFALGLLWELARDAKYADALVDLGGAPLLVSYLVKDLHVNSPPAKVLYGRSTRHLAATLLL